MNQAQIAKHLRCSGPAISKHKKKLLKWGYLQRGVGYYWDRGPNAKYIEEAELYKRVKQLSDATEGPGVELNFGPQPSIYSGHREQPEFIPTIRAHMNGAIMFVVDKIGDMSYLKLGLNGSSQVLFEETPYNTTGATKYRGKLTHPDGWSASLQLWESSQGSDLRVWLPEEHLTRKMIAEKDVRGFAPFRRRAYAILDLLEKHGGWKFKRTRGHRLGYNQGTVEYGYSNPYLNRIIPDKFTGIKGHPVHVDHSPGPQEIESRDINDILPIMDARQTFDALTAKEKALENEIALLRVTLREKEVVHLKEMNRLYDVIGERDRLRHLEEEQQRTLKDGMFQ